MNGVLKERCGAREVMMTAALKTDASLIERLRKAAEKPITKDELARQRVSFVFGNLPDNSGITREQVSQKIKENEGA
jgi:hypothetical protein